VRFNLQTNKRQSPSVASWCYVGMSKQQTSPMHSVEWMGMTVTAMLVVLTHGVA